MENDNSEPGILVAIDYILIGILTIIVGYAAYEVYSSYKIAAIPMSEITARKEFTIHVFEDSLLIESLKDVRIYKSGVIVKVNNKIRVLGGDIALKQSEIKAARQKGEMLDVKIQDYFNQTGQLNDEISGLTNAVLALDATRPDPDPVPGPVPIPKQQDPCRDSIEILDRYYNQLAAELYAATKDCN